ncbi:MAG: hypothetical protein JNK64_38930 [Myxococcales bacterium]|nr:hypothetical protein [Myxococcales bacterium]
MRPTPASPAVGILGLGVHLPPEIRTNAWWPRDAVDRWRERMALRATLPDLPPDAPAGVRATIDAMARYADDPFRGAVTRRVMTPPATTTDMEAAAARAALEDAGIAATDVDVLLTQTPVPERLMVNEACPTHHALGLRRSCLAFGTEAACNGFAVHAELAAALIAAGRARHVLSVHSSAITRVHGPTEPHSAWWGDGAAAVLWGPVRAGRGLLATQHNVDGTACDALVLGVPERRWWEAGEVTTHAVDREHTRAMLLTLIERGRAAIAAALAASEVAPADVRFFAPHQGTIWLGETCRVHAGLSAARTITTFPETANMNSVNVPYVLWRGREAGWLGDDDVAVTFAGGLGETWSSTVIRWGR